MPTTASLAHLLCHKTSFCSPVRPRMGHAAGTMATPPCLMLRCSLCDEESRVYLGNQAETLGPWLVTAAPCTCGEGLLCVSSEIVSPSRPCPRDLTKAFFLLCLQGQSHRGWHHSVGTKAHNSVYSGGNGTREPLPQVAMTSGLLHSMTAVKEIQWTPLKSSGRLKAKLLE